MKQMKMLAGAVSLVLLASCGQNSAPASQGSVGQGEEQTAGQAQMTDLTGQAVVIARTKSVTVPVKTASGTVLGQVKFTIDFRTDDNGDGTFSRDFTVKAESTVPRYGEFGNGGTLTSAAGIQAVGTYASLEAAGAGQISTALDYIFPNDESGAYCVTVNPYVKWNGPFAFNVPVGGDMVIPTTSAVMQLCDPSATPPALPANAPKIPTFTSTSKTVKVTSSSSAVNGQISATLALFHDGLSAGAYSTVRSTVNRYGEYYAFTQVLNSAGAQVSKSSLSRFAGLEPSSTRQPVVFNIQTGGFVTAPTATEKLCATSQPSVNFDGPFSFRPPLTDGVTVTVPDLNLNVCEVGTPTPPTPPANDPYSKAKIETSLDKARGGTAALPYAIVTNVPAGTYLRGLVTFERTLDCQANKAKALSDKFSFKTENYEFTGKVIPGLTFGTQMNSVIRVYDASNVLRRTFRTTVCYF